jgi:CHAT domain-containing protein
LPSVGGVERNLQPGVADESSFGFHMKVLSTRANAIPAEEAALVEEMFVTAQDSTISASAKAMAQTAARTAAGTGPLADLVRQQQDLTKSVGLADKAVQDALARRDAAAIAPAQAELYQRIAALRAINKDLSAKYPEYDDLINPGALSIAEVQARLSDQDALLLLQPSVGDVYGLAVTKDGVAWHRNPLKQPEAETLIAALRCQMDSANCAADEANLPPPTPSEREGYRRYDLAKAYQLYQLMIAPVAPLLAGKKHIYVVSSGALSTLPLAALIDSDPGSGDDADPARLESASWLAEKYAFTNLPAVSALRGALAHSGQSGAETKAEKWQFMGIGAPTLLGRPGETRGKRGTSRGGFFRAGLDGNALADPSAIRQLDPLPGTERELAAMAKALDADASSILTGDQATETAVRESPALSKGQVLVFATHGLLPGDIKGLDEPALVFTPPATASLADDGVLSASEAAALKLDARWIILSACNTASATGQSGGPSGGDSLSGLSRAFLYAGARSLLASNWRVGDAETALLTVETITANRAHPDRGNAAALQSAMRIVRTGRREDGTTLDEWVADWAHPASWAPFVHIANGN